MSLPVNINNLINGQIVEWERIEFKAGWNPKRVLHTICAFANDFNNWGGGYIILGIEAKDGRPVLPLKGLPLNCSDNIQKELLNLCHRLRPNYFPIVEPIGFQGKQIMIIWVPGGSNRPYEAPENLTQNSRYFPFIRRFSNTVKATVQERNELLSMANQVPFDDQINHQAELNDLDRSLILIYLGKVKSALTSEISNMPYAQFCRKLNIVEGPDEYLKPKNVGLLFFNPNPETFIKESRVEVVTFKNEVGDQFSEKIFKGPIHNQILEVLEYLSTNIINETVHKVNGQAEAVRFFNYPLAALEEGIVNAVYHKDYQQNAPVEIRIFNNRIEILSYPGPLPPLNKENLMTGNVTARRYRNRRIGDLLKELHLTEGRGTGFPKIRRALKNNGSPAPIFETDDERTYFLTKIFRHPFIDVNAVLSLLSNHNKNVLQFCQQQRSRQEILNHLGLSNHSKNYNKFIIPMMEAGYLTLTIQDKPNAPNQKYVLTNSGYFIVKKLIRELS